MEAQENAGNASARNTAGTNNAAADECLTVKEFARKHKLSDDYARKLFEHEPGVLKFTKPHRNTRKRPYVTLRIPKEVINRVLERIRGK